MCSSHLRYSAPKLPNPFWSEELHFFATVCNVLHGKLMSAKGLQDEAASVRQAAVDLLGSHIGTRRDLALAYFDTLVTASRDTSTSVHITWWPSCV